MALVTPKHTGELYTFFSSLEVLNNHESWIDNETFKNELFELYVDNRQQNEYRIVSGKPIKKNDESDYTKDLQLPMYFGFAEADSFRSNSNKRITKDGKALLEAYRNNDKQAISSLFLNAFKKCSFGRNNYGCIRSDSDYEAPAILFRSIILLNGIKNKEFAYILNELDSYHRDYSEIISEITINRESDSFNLRFEELNTDIKFITLLCNLGLLFRDRSQRLHLNQSIDKTEVYNIPITNSDKYVKLDNNMAQSITSDDELNNQIHEKNLQYLAAIRTKPFILLAGISGTGKSRIVRKFAQATVTEELQRQYDPISVMTGFDCWNLHKPANFELIQVKPNWHNSMEVVGYKSNIGGIHYEFTPFVEFVARAWRHQDVPFFLCLDEMNLAPVEQYFAEFLSAIESRTVENGFYMTDPIIKPFENFDTKDNQGNVIDCLSDRMIAKLIGALDTQEKSELAEHFRTKGLTLPKNLIVMGTVNMDETTFSFSRKVLDRAMSIEMNQVDLEAYFNHQSDVISTELSNEIKNALIDRPISGLEVIEALGDDADEVRSYFEAVNIKLDGTPFKLGYRAISEALLYASAAKVFGCESLIDALDQFTLMKILSRIEGDKRSIGNLLVNLQSIINESYTESHKKLMQMADTLEDSQFVSYWV